MNHIEEEEPTLGGIFRLLHLNGYKNQIEGLEEKKKTETDSGTSPKVK